LQVTVKVFVAFKLNGNALTHRHLTTETWRENGMPSASIAIESKLHFAAKDQITCKRNRVDCGPGLFFGGNH